jgi:hypothetical protein
MVKIKTNALHFGSWAGIFCPSSPDFHGKNFTPFRTFTTKVLTEKSDAAIGHQAKLGTGFGLNCF